MTSSLQRISVPRTLRTGLTGILLLAGAASVPALGEFGPMPMTILLDIWIVSLMVYAIVRWAIPRGWPLVVVVTYLASRVAPALVSDSPVRDFLQAYRWVLYLIAFLLAGRMRWGAGSSGPLRVTTLLLIGMAFTKAVFTYYYVGPGQRPGLLIENNFEIALFSGLLAVVLSSMTARERVVSVGLLTSLMLLSGSRSGAAAVAVLSIYFVSQLRATDASKRVIALALVPVIVAVPVWVFSERTAAGGGLQRLDRLNFLRIFEIETSYWGLFNWIFGTMPITPLAVNSCAQLSAFDSLYSSSGDGSCYSVILHAFVLRVLFDAGVLGLILALIMPWVAMRRAGLGFSLPLTLLAIAVTNSLSVSGLNSPYVALPILLAITTGASKKESVPRRPMALMEPSLAISKNHQN